MGASATLKRRRPSSPDRERENMGAASRRCRLPSADFRERKNTGNTLKRGVAQQRTRVLPPKAKVLTANHSRFAIKGYLVESTKGDLLHVRRFLKEEAKEFWTQGFRVYKLVFKGKDESAAEQVEVKSIGGEAIFVGDNYSMSVLASHHPGLQPNCIYYTDDLQEVADHPQHFNYNGPSDMGIFNLEDETIARHYHPSPRSITNKPAPFWIVPPSNGFC